jgi:hypothetical protein
MGTVASLTHEVSKDRTISLEFLDAECDCPAAEGISLIKNQPVCFSGLRLSSGVSGLFEPPFACWFTYDCESIAQAHELILSAVEDDGPFDGVIGFSQGAAIAASVIIHHAETHPLEPQYSLFKCAIFVCGGLPPNYEGTRLLSPQDDGQVIKIPTAHIVGKKDSLYPDCMALHGLCEKSNSLLYDHGQGHEIPRDPNRRNAMAAVIKSTMDRAVLLQ